MVASFSKPSHLASSNKYRDETIRCIYFRFLIIPKVWILNLIHFQIIHHYSKEEVLRIGGTVHDGGGGGPKCKI